MTAAIEPLEIRQLLSAGLIGQYFGDTTLTKLDLTRTDANIGFDWGSASPGTGVPADAFSVRWTGQITPTTTSTTWQLGVWTDGGVRLYVNNQLVINDWAIPSGGAVSYFSPTLSLTAGQSYNYRLEYFSTTSSTTDIYIGWQTNANNLTDIPSADLSTTYVDTTAPSVPTGLAASNTTSTGTILTWAASTDDLGVTSYDIFRNGTKVGTSTTPTYTDSGLSGSTTYSYTVDARDAAGNVSAVSTALPVTTLAGSDTTPPSAPTGLTLTGTTDTTDSFSWTASTDNVGVVGYTILRNGTKVGTTTGLTYTDIGLTPNTAYSYTVTASDAAGNVSSPSTALPITTAADTTAPTAPGNPQLTGTTDTTDTFSWTASTDDIGVTGYTIFRNGAKVGTTTGLTYTDIGLTPNTTYSYTVTASDAAGNASSPSTALPITTAADTTPPSIPQGLGVTATTSTTVGLSWSASTDDIGVTGYSIFRNGTKVGTSPTTTYTDSGLTASTAYSYTVEASDAAGNLSAPSSAVIGTTAAAAVTNGLIAQYFDDTTLTKLDFTRTDPTIGFDWGNASPGGSVPANAFSVRWTGQITPTSTSTTWQLGIWTDGGVRVYLNNQLVINQWAIPAGGAVSYLSPTLTLTVGQKYNYRVEYFSTKSSTTDIYIGWQTNSSNLGDIPTANLFTSYVDTTAPSVPTGLAASNTTSTGTTLTWAASTDDVGVTSYDIFRNGTKVGTSTTPTYTDSGLSGSTTYSYTVDARDAAGNVSAVSTALPVTTLAGSDTTPPSAPTGLTLTGTTDTTDSFSWTASTDNVGVVGYTILRNGTKVGTTTGLTYTDIGLTPNTAYSYTVTASDAAGNVSSPSTALPITTAADTTPPSIPQGLAVTGSTATTVSLSWSASTDDIGVTGYSIFRNGTKVGTSATTSYTDSGLAGSTTYNYTVEASDAAGNLSTSSASVPGTTLAPPVPTTPAGFTVINTTSSSVSFSWTASTDSVGVVSYTIYRNGVNVGTALTNSYTDTGLAANTGYSYTVTATDAAGTVSLTSSPLAATTAAITTGLTARYYGDITLSTLDLTRVDPNVNFSWGTGSPSPSVPVDQFSARWVGQISPTTSSTYTFGITTDGAVRLWVNNQLVINDWFIPSNTASTSYTSAGISLKAGTKYNFRLEFQTITGNADINATWKPSTGSQTTIPTTVFSTGYTDATAPSAPTLLATSYVSTSSVTLSWATSTDDVAVANYDVYRNGIKVGSTSALSWTDGVLTAGTDYTYTVYARDAAGNVSLASAPLLATTLAPSGDTVPPSVPTGLQESQAAPTTLSLSWAASSDNVGVTQYNIYRNGVFVGTSAKNSYNDSGLAPATTYTYTVTAADAAANVSATSSPFAGATAAVTNGLVGQYYGDGSLTGPVILTRTDANISFSWVGSSPDPSIQPGDFSARWTGQVMAPTTGSYTFATYSSDGVRVYINDTLIIDDWLVQPTATLISATAMTLTAGQKYNIRVEYFSIDSNAQVIVGWTPPGGSLSAIPSADLFTSYSNNYAPSVPQYVATPVITSTSALVSWAASSDDLGVTGYNVYRNGTLMGTTSGTSLLDGGLTPSTSYTYTVKAFDGAGNLSAASTAITLTTPASGSTPSIIQAATGTVSSGARISGGIVTSLDGGDYLMLPNVNLGTNAQTLQAYVSVPLTGAGAQLQIRLDSATGPVVGTLTLQATGPGTTNSYVLQTATLSGASGVHNVYLTVASGPSVGSLAWVRFDQNKQINIMAIGDSITTGPDGEDDYRYTLYKELQAGGYDVNFVGSQTSAFDYFGTTNPLNFDFDQNNEGHPGWTAQEEVQLVTAWAQAAQPDIVLLHLGTNDVHGETTSQITGYLGQMITDLRSVNPNVKILLAQIIPSLYNVSAINALNAAIPTLASQMTTAASPITVVNENGAINPNTMLLDGTHPNEVGFAAMAAVWYASLQQALK